MSDKVVTVSEEELMKAGMECATDRGKVDPMMTLLVMAVVADLIVHLFHPEKLDKKEEA